MVAQDLDVLIPGDDGLPVRSVGGWVHQKAHYVDRYARMFATGMKYKWPQRAYVELFAGPGRSWDRDGHVYVDGSAIRALGAEFTDYVFVDLDREATAALAERSRRLGRAPCMIQGDCNEVIDQVIAAIPRTSLSLCFVDPTNWQVRFDTVTKLVSARKVDLLLTFMYSSMRRVELCDPPALTAFFGTDAWRNELRRPRWQQLDALLSLYSDKLEALRYLPSYSRRVILGNGRSWRYALVLFSRDHRGVDFWEKSIGGPAEDGQLSLAL